MGNFPFVGTATRRNKSFADMAQRKLVIFETTHHETLPAMLDLANDYFYTTAVFLKAACYENLCSNRQPEMVWPNAVFFRQGNDQPNRAFIKQALSFLKTNGYTHLHISTLDNNFLYFSLRLLSLTSVQVSLSLQAINEYCAYKFGDLRDLTESIAKKILHKKIRHYRVFFPLMTTLVQQRLPQAKSFFIPPRFFSPATPRFPSAPDDPARPFKIVIPGTVDPIRRNYESVIDFLAGFLPFDPRNDEFGRIELVILGNSRSEYGKKIITRLQALQLPFFVLTYYENNIPQSEYERQLSEADLLWSPIQVLTLGIRATGEVYGQSTATGMTGDLLFNCTPALVPYGFAIPEHYEHALLTYKSPAELGTLITTFMNDPGHAANVREQIGRSFSAFTMEAFKGPFRELMGIRTP
jgi:hypothetical protein